MRGSRSRTPKVLVVTSSFAQHDDDPTAAFGASIYEFVRELGRFAEGTVVTPAVSTGSGAITGSGASTGFSGGYGGAQFRPPIQINPVWAQPTNPNPSENLG